MLNYHTGDLVINLQKRNEKKSFFSSFFFFFVKGHGSCWWWYLCGLVIQRKLLLSFLLRDFQFWWLVFVAMSELSFLSSPCPLLLSLLVQRHVRALFSWIHLDPPCKRNRTIMKIHVPVICWFLWATEWKHLIISHYQQLCNSHKCCYKYNYFFSD